MTADSSYDNLPELSWIIDNVCNPARKVLGQNFLTNIALLDNIALAAGSVKKYHVIEVGPGPGGLTRAILKNGAAKVTSIEKDQNFNAALKPIKLQYHDKFQLLFSDATNIDYQKLLFHGLKTKIIANLPFNVGTKILLNWILIQEWPPWFESITVMLQKEVGERLIASPASKQYGRLSVIAQLRSKINYVMNVPGTMFQPKAKVDACVINIFPINVGYMDIKNLQKITSLAFSNRRKMVKNNLIKYYPNIGETLTELGINNCVRAEEISPNNFYKLSQQLTATTS